MKKINVLLFTLVTGYLSACANHAKDAFQDAIVGTQQQKTADDLQGSWISSCIDNEIGGGHGGRIMTLQFTDTNFMMYVDNYYGKDCTVFNKTTYQSGSYTIQKKYDANTYLLEYLVPVDAHTSALMSQKIQVNATGLMVSEISASATAADALPLTITMKPD